MFFVYWGCKSDGEASTGDGDGDGDGESTNADGSETYVDLEAEEAMEGEASDAFE